MDSSIQQEDKGNNHSGLPEVKSEDLKRDNKTSDYSNPYPKQSEAQSACAESAHKAAD